MLLIATKNQGKLREIRKLFKGLKIISLNKIKKLPKVVESGRTFYENALKKARFYSKATGYLTLAEDSGIEVKVLGGRPGIFSSRYSGKNATDKKNNWKLLKELEGKTDRRARYQAVVVIAKDGVEVARSAGFCYGRIAQVPRGRYGFGYDPIFIPRGYKKTFAQLGLKVKNKISHRAKAIKKIKKRLLKVLKP
jgi:XTP/dITP diphosphohydrolase